jgi:hypothetical protein
LPWQIRISLVLVLCALAGVAWGRGGDPFDTLSIDWRLTDWRRLEVEEQHWVAIGFALGWRGLERTESSEKGQWGLAVTAARRKRLDRIVEAAADPASRLAPHLMRGEAERPLASAVFTGHDWMRLPVRLRFAVLHGFYAGVYARALHGRLGSEADFDPAFGRARRLVRPELALVPPLAHARLSDWYFYTNHRDAPLAESIRELAEQIRG